MFGIDLNVILGNFCSLVAMGTDTVGSSRKSAGAMLFWQCLSQIAMATGAILLGAYSAAVQNGVSFFRNLRASVNKGGKWLEWVFLAIAVVVGVYCNFWLPNTIGIWIGLIPIIANVWYSLAVYFWGENEKKLKFAFLITNVVFGFFNFMIKNYVGFGTCVFVATATTIFLTKSRNPAETHVAATTEGKDSKK
ncbi:MAG: YgjV family protein [Oscillospiraceae bacterium]|nr:YgjV family protein [Oscillospiraceae bacterium]